MKEFFTIEGKFDNTTVIERSKFICYIKGIEDEEDAKNFIAEIKKLNSLATHNCYAYIADSDGLVQKFSDDGEPQGTAGLPMLEVLKARKLYKTVAVVTRYFGGIKLGTGGLTRAYSGAVTTCLDNAKIINLKEAVILELPFNYEDYSKFLNAKFNGIKIVSTDFDQEVKVVIAVQKTLKEEFVLAVLDAFNGKIQPKIIKEEFFGF